MKKISALTLTLIVIACFSTAATAGPARRHTIEGIVLGTGIAIMGTAILHGMNKGHQPCLDSPKHKRHTNNRHQRQYARNDNGPRGHWEIQKIWVTDKHQKRWNSGHTTSRGRWVNGRHKRVRAQRGHWQAQRVWVETKHKHR
jgi:hypothetical protein